MPVERLSREVAPPQLRNRFSERVAPVLITPDSERLTKSEFADECDINKIMSRYVSTGQLPDFSYLKKPEFADVSEVPDFAAMNDLVINAYDEFMQLPAEVRLAFGNDPAVFVDQVDSAYGREVLDKHGLLKPLDSDHPPVNPPLSRAEGAPLSPAVQAVSEEVEAVRRPKVGKSEA